MIAKKGNNTTADFPKEILNVCVKDQMKILEKLHIGKDPKKTHILYAKISQSTRRSFYSPH